MQTLNRQLDQSKRQTKLIRVETCHPGGDSIDGIVLYQTDVFVVLAVEEDFEFNGIAVVSKKFIRKLRDSKYERCCNKIIKFNKSIEKIKPQAWLKNCLSFEDILKQLNRKNIWPSIETIFCRKNMKMDFAFYIGPVQTINLNELLIESYDADASWEGAYKIKIQEVYKITFFDRYSKHFNKFMQSSKSKHF